jgi:hypothetical protein
MNFGVFVLGLELSELEKCDAVERSLYHFVGIGFWIFLLLASVSGAVNLYYIDDRWMVILAGAVGFPLLLGFLYRILLLSVKRPARFTAKKWFLRWIPDLGTFVRLAVVFVLTLLIAMPISGIMQYERVEKVAQDKRDEIGRLTLSENSSRSFEASIQSDIDASEHTHYPVAVYTDLLQTGLTRFVIFMIGMLVFYPVLLLLILKFLPKFTYQDAQNIRVELNARQEYQELESLMVAQFSKFGSVAVFPHNSAFEDYPINSLKKPELVVRVKNDAELLNMLWQSK